MTSTRRLRWRMVCRGRLKVRCWAIADRADTIAGMFGLGMVPTGSKDPFALRRAANGVVKILAETDVASDVDRGDFGECEG